MNISFTAEQVEKIVALGVTPEQIANFIEAAGVVGQTIDTLRESVEVLMDVVKMQGERIEMLETQATREV